MQTAATRIALQLNGLSYAQKQAVRALIETLLLKTSAEPIADILAQTTFMDDLVVSTDDNDSVSYDESTNEEGEVIEDQEEDKEEGEDGSEDEEDDGYFVVDESSDIDMDISEEEK
ncbi:hypothetical protein VNI00_005497 [Paramarasmius palmivorus]|uniref:Uncharacterized protein n=1 Tax=Paramarasmius palmivorus TaxID=297713 RepID=A0AAW0DAV7_9AGAR